MNPILRITRNQQVYMIWHCFQFDNLAKTFGTNFANDRFKSSVDFAAKYIASVFRAPNYVVFTGIANVVVGFVLHVDNYTACRYLVNPYKVKRRLTSPCRKVGALRLTSKIKKTITCTAGYANDYCQHCQTNPC